MTLVMLLVLVWALVLAPAAWRSRRHNPEVTVGGFHRAMDVLRDRPPGRQVLVPSDSARIVGVAEARRNRVLEARRRMFGRLLAVAGSSTLAALVFGGRVWFVAGLTLAVFGGYVALLLTWKQQRAEAERVVRELATASRLEQRFDHEQVAEPLARAVGGGWAGTPSPEQLGNSVRIRRWDD